MSMKRFITLGLILLAISIFLTVAVWWSLQQALPAVTANTPAKPSLSADSVERGDTHNSANEVLPASSDQLVTEEVGVVSQDDLTLYQPIYTRDLELSEVQISLLETAGIDVDTFVVTPAMQACAAATIESERLTDILAGAPPSFREGVALLSCL